MPSTEMMVSAPRTAMARVSPATCSRTTPVSARMDEEEEPYPPPLWESL